MSLASDIQRAFTLIRQLQGALDGKTIRVGTGTLVFTASTDSADATITHGLGTMPTTVLACAASAPNFTDIPSFNAHTLGATTFLMNGRKAAASTVNVTFYWLVIG